MIGKMAVGFLAMGLLLFSGCGTTRDEQKHGAIHVINVLDVQYYQDAHISGSENVPFDNFEQDAASKFEVGSWLKNDRFVIYCANYQCSSSCEAAKILRKLGVTDVHVYEGGMAEWKHKGYACVGSATEGYLNIVGEPSGVSCDGIGLVTAEQLKEWLSGKSH